MSNNTNVTLSPYFLSLLHHCRHGNVSASRSTPSPVSSTEEGEEAEDTDFGAVLYITAVLVFYSLGIVVMIVKYLKTERKEMEEELALENFFKGIPSKKIEHEQEAVNRVAIRAFHTLTSGASRTDQLPITIVPTTQGARSGNYDPYSEIWNEVGPDLEDSDSSKGDASPSMLHRERSKYLPRVSLMFRDSRSSDRRKMQDSIRSKSGRSALQERPISGQRIPQSALSFHLMENGQIERSLDVCGEDFDDCDNTTTQRMDSCSRTLTDSPQRTTRQKLSGKLRNGEMPGGVGVRFQDDCRLPGKRPRSKIRAKSSSSFPGSSTKTVSDKLPTTDNSREEVAASETASDPVDVNSQPSSSALEQSEGCTGSSQVVIGDVCDEHSIVAAQQKTECCTSPKGLLVSDV